MQNTTIQECPVLYPTVKQFENFREFVEMIDKNYKNKYGMVKIVPPKNWVPHMKDYEKKLQNLIVNSPIQQNTFGKGGIYQCLHIPKKSMSYAQYKSKSKQYDRITDGLKTDAIQQMFWKNVTFSAPVYGADLLNTIMDQSSKAWNMNNLDSILRESVQNKVKGINTPYCYVGAWKAFFCWHTEDLDLSGINFIHFGKSKFWYAINYQDKKIIQNQANRLFPEHFTSCKQFLRHKTTLINPYYLKKKYPELRISKIQHKANEFIMVMGGSYHCGFNFGFNFAEAINYASVDWLRQIIDVKSCQCTKSSVKASVYQIYKNLSILPHINKTKEFLRFQEFIYKKAQQQESQQQLQEAKKGVTQLFSKKIKKTKKVPNKIYYNNEQYRIEHWAQCQKCRLWRVVKRAYKQNDYFQCKNGGKVCNKKQKLQKNTFTISQTK